MSQDIHTGVLVAQSMTAGASEAFARVLVESTDGRHHARSQVARALRNGSEPSPEAFGAGGWYTALWRGETDRAWRLADSANRKLMRGAGLAPVTAGAPARQD